MLSRNSLVSLAIATALGAYGTYELVTRVVLVKEEEIKDQEVAKEKPKEVVPEENPPKAVDPVPPKAATPDPKVPVVPPKKPEATQSPSLPKKPETPPAKPAAAKPVAPDNAGVAKPNPTSPKVPQPQPQPQPAVVNQNSSGSGDLLENLTAGSLGLKFKAYLIGDTNDQAWSGKLFMWNLQINTGSAKDPFYFKKGTQVEKEQLITRCKNAYQLQWSAIPGSRDEDRRSYKSMIWTFCGKPTEDNAPNGWF